jgi:heat shock protein HslJ
MLMLLGVNMKGIFFTAVIITTMLMSCRSTPQAPASTGPTVNELAGKDWKLTEVRINNINTGFNRSDLARSGYTDGFTLSFDNEMIGGVGAPNRYSAPYTLKTNNQIIIALIRATLMAPIREPDKLREHDYFGYLQNAGSWSFVNNNLHINSKTEDGRTVLLIFSL